MPDSRPRWLPAAAAGFFLALAAAGNAAMDTLAARYATSRFARAGLNPQWWDPRISWHNKWKDGVREHGPAFFLSDTTLVFLTDGWHACKTLTLTCLYVAAIVPWAIVHRWHWAKAVAAWFLVQLFFGLVFEAAFRFLAR